MNEQMGRIPSFDRLASVENVRDDGSSTLPKLAPSRTYRSTQLSGTGVPCKLIPGPPMERWWARLRKLRLELPRQGGIASVEGAAPLFGDGRRVHTRFGQGRNRRRHHNRYARRTRCRDRKSPTSTKWADAEAKYRERLLPERFERGRIQARPIDRHIAVTLNASARKCRMRWTLCLNLSVRQSTARLALTAFRLPVAVDKHRSSARPIFDSDTKTRKSTCRARPPSRARRHTRDTQCCRSFSQQNARC